MPSSALRSAPGSPWRSSLLLVIWAWTAFIWFFNWLGSLVLLPVPVTSQLIGLVVGAVLGAAGVYWIASNFLSDWRKFGVGVVGLILGALIGGIAGLGWLLGMLVPAVGATVAYRIIRKGIFDAMAVWPPLPRTRETLKGNLEWLQAPEDTEREIVRLRGDMTAAVAEVERRFRGGFARCRNRRSAHHQRARTR